MASTFTVTAHLRLLHDPHKDRRERPLCFEVCGIDVVQLLQRHRIFVHSYYMRALRKSLAPRT